MMKMKSYKKKWMVCVLIFSVILGIWTGKGGSAQTTLTAGMGRAEGTLEKSFPIKIKEEVRTEVPLVESGKVESSAVESGTVESGTVESGAVESGTVEETPIPTNPPTVAPTSMPTLMPTAEPSQEPTEEPTEEPTVAPTPVQTTAPSAEPSEEPTPSITPAVTPEKTGEPTEEPTVAPTPVQTIAPSAEPSEEPTPSITPAVTPEKTGEPTEEPTSVPVQTTEPSEKPTFEPAPEITPTPIPSIVPGPTPTPEPSAEPTPTPVQTMEPTTPMPEQTAEPTPTPEPTETKNPVPSEEPSTDPTDSPDISPMPTESVNPIPTPETPGIESGVLEQPGESASPVPSIDPSLFPPIPPITYTIKLDANGGVVSESSIEFTAMQISTLTLPEPTRKGYIFIGWYDGKTRVEKITAIKNITLKAQWAKKELKCTYPNLDLKKAVSSDVKLEKVSIEKKYTKYVKLNQKKGTMKAKRYFRKAKVSLMIDGKKVDVTVELKLPQPKVKATEGKMKHYATGAYREFKFSYKNVAAGATKVVAEYKPSNAKKFKKCGSLQNRFKGAYAVVKKGKSVWFRVTIYYGKYASPKSKKIPLKG